MLRTSEESQRVLPPFLYQFAALLTGLMSICFFVEIIARRIYQLHYAPYWEPLFEEYFPDFVAFRGRFQFFHSDHFFHYSSNLPFMYPAPVAVVYKAFYLLPAHSLFTFLFLGASAFLLASLWLTRHLLKRGVPIGDALAFPLIVILCSYPVWFALKQANMEIVIWAIVATGLELFLRGKGYSAAACFGVAAAMKVFPFVYLGLFLSRKQFKQIGLAFLVLVATTLVSLWLVDPDVHSSWTNISTGLNLFRFLYMLHIRPEIGADHSLFALIKLLIRPVPTTARLDHLLPIYLATAALAGTALFFSRIIRLPLLNQILCLTVASILLPPTSFEYTLLHLLLPFALFVLLAIDASRTGEISMVLKVVLGCFGILLAFIPELIHHGLSFGGQVKCLVLLVLFAIALWRPFDLVEAPTEARA